MRPVSLAVLLATLPLAATATPRVDRVVQCTLTSHCTEAGCTPAKASIAFSLFHMQTSLEVAGGPRLAAVQFDWQGTTITDYVYLLDDDAFQVSVNPAQPGTPPIAIYAQAGGPVHIATVRPVTDPAMPQPGMSFGTCAGGQV